MSDSQELPDQAADVSIIPSRSVWPPGAELPTELTLLRQWSVAAIASQEAGNEEHAAELSNMVVSIHQQHLTAEPPNPVDSLFLAECHHFLGQHEEAMKFLDGVEELPGEICGRDEALKSWEALRAEYGR